MPIRLDLIGSSPGCPHEAEVLAQAPSRWYLTGFLAPLDASQAQRLDEPAADDIDEASDTEGGDDATAPDLPSANRADHPPRGG